MTLIVFDSMRDMVKFFGEELSKNEELLSSERKAARAVLSLFVEGAFSYLAVDHADIDEDEFSLKSCEGRSGMGRGRGEGRAVEEGGTRRR